MDFLARSRATSTDADAAPRVSTDEDALLRCGLSKSYLDAGDYERAREAMGALWRRVGDRPSVEGLSARAAVSISRSMA